MGYREPLRAPLSWMRDLEPGESDKSSCLWCKHLCTLQDLSPLYICRINKIYFSQGSVDATPALYDKVSCVHHEKESSEIIPTFEGVEDMMSSREDKPFMVMFS